MEIAAEMISPCNRIVAQPGGIGENELRRFAPGLESRGLDESELGVRAAANTPKKIFGADNGEEKRFRIAV